MKRNKHTEQEQKALDTKYLQMLATYKQEKLLHITTGNSKTGIASWNMLAGDHNHPYNGKTPHAFKEQFAGVCGTCHCDCPGCYAKDETRTPETAAHMLVNTITAQNDLNRVYNFINAYLKLYFPRYFRGHDSGDIINKDYLNMMIQIALDNPQIHFYTYTKRFDLLIDIKDLPSNLTINLSPWAGVTDDSLYNKLVQTGLYGVFMYDSNKDLQGVHCPAVNKDGSRNKKVTCALCRRCTEKNITAVYPH